MGWFYLALAYLSLFTLGMGDNARGPVFPDLIREFGLSDSLAALFFFVSSAAACLNNLCAPFWVPRLGSFRALQFYSVLQVVGFIVMGFSTHYVSMLIGSSIVGLSMGGLGISLNILASESVSTAKRRQALSGLHCMYGVASLLAPLLVTGLFRFGINWKEVFLFIAMGPVLVLGFSALTKSPTSSKAKEVDASSVVDKDGPSDSPRRSSTYRYAGIVALYVIAEIAISSRLVLYARRDVGMSLESANELLSFFFLTLFLGRLAFALIHVPLRNSSVLALSGGASLLFFCLGLFHHPAWLALCGLSMSMFYPCAMTLVTEETGRESGLVMSWIVTTQSLGLMAMHFAIGWLSDRFGLGKALWIGPLCLIVMLILLGTRGGVKVISGSPRQGVS